MKNFTRITGLISLFCALAFIGNAQTYLIDENFQSWTEHKSYSTFTQEVTGAGTYNATQCMNFATGNPNGTTLGECSEGYLQMNNTKSSTLVLPEVASIGDITIGIISSSASGTRTVKITNNANGDEVATFVYDCAANNKTGKLYTETVNIKTPVTLKIEVIGATYIHDLKISQYEAPTVPTLTVAENLDFETQYVGSSTPKTLNIKGDQLTDSEFNYTVTGDAFSGSGTITAAELTSETGKDIEITFAPTEVKSYTGTVTITSAVDFAGDKAVTIALTGNGKATPTEVATIAAMKEAFETNPDQEFSLTGKPVVTFVSPDYTHAKYIQDATGNLLIFDREGIITGEYAVGDEIGNLKGTLSIYNGMMQFAPLADAVKGESGKTVTPQEKIPADITADDAAALVLIKNVEIDATGNWTKGQSYNLKNIASPVIRTQYDDMPYIGQPIPAEAQDITGVVLVFNTTIQLVPQSFVTSIPGSIETSDINTLKVYASNGTVYVNAPAGSNIEVYNILGQIVAQTTAIDGLTTISIQKAQKGIYLVKVGNKTQSVKL